MRECMTSLLCLASALACSTHRTHPYPVDFPLDGNSRRVQEKDDFGILDSSVLQPNCANSAVSIVWGARSLFLCL